MENPFQLHRHGRAYPVKDGRKHPYVPAIHVFGVVYKDVDTGHKAGHDDSL
jgi:hypothetical protein